MLFRSVQKPAAGINPDQYAVGCGKTDWRNTGRCKIIHGTCSKRLDFRNKIKKVFATIVGMRKPFIIHRLKKNHCCENLFIFFLRNFVRYPFLKFLLLAFVPVFHRTVITAYAAEDFCFHSTFSHVNLLRPVRRQI